MIKVSLGSGGGGGGGGGGVGVGGGGWGNLVCVCGVGDGGWGVGAVMTLSSKQLATAWTSIDWPSMWTPEKYISVHFLCLIIIKMYLKITVLKCISHHREQVKWNASFWSSFVPSVVKAGHRRDQRVNLDPLDAEVLCMHGLWIQCPRVPPLEILKFLLIPCVCGEGFCD